MADNTTPVGPPGAANWALLLGTSILWGSAFLGMSAALADYGPLTVAAGRCSIATVVLAVVILATGQLRGLSLTPAEAGRIALVGLVNIAVPFALLAWALQHVPSAFAGVTMGSVPIFLMPLVFLFQKDETIGPRRIAGLVVGFAGLVILVGPGAALEDGALLGRLACLGAVIGYALGSILTRRAPPVPPLVLTGGMLCTASLVLVPLALILEGLPAPALDGATAALVYTGVMPTALAFVLRTRIIRSAGSLFMSLVSYLVPIWAVIFGVALRGEDLPATLFAGLALILAGIGLSEMKARRRPVSRSPHPGH